MKRRVLSSLVLAAALVWMPFAANAFGVAPAMLDLSASRGEVVQSRFSIINSTAADQTYYLEAITFIAREDSGSPQFIPYEEDHAGLPEWIRFPSKTVSVPANSQGEMPFQIAVPADVASGEYFAAITVSDTPSEVVATNGASVSAKIAVLVFLTVEGETLQKAALLDFTAPDAGSLTRIPSLSFAYRIQNQGNVHVVPTATVTARDMFGRVVASTNANPDATRILPGTTRSISGSLGLGDDLSFMEALRAELVTFAIGPITYTLDVQVGDQRLTGDPIRGWNVPWELIAVFTGAVLLVLLASRLFTRRR
jgi:hypothetical protein